MKIQFEVMGTNEFGIFHVKRKAKKGFDEEETFRNCLKSLPKYISKGWESITFDFDIKTIEVSKYCLIETNYDFHNSINVTLKERA